VIGKASTRLNLVLAVLIFFNIQTAGAQSRTAFPRLEPDPKALEYYRINAGGRRLTWQELAEISLWASGDTSASSLGRISAAVEQLKSSPDLPSASADRAEFILSFMHKNILRSYSLYQTRVDTIFTNGRFNCVSSAVLYMIFCEALGIPAWGVMTKDHAFVMIPIGGMEYDVETTNRYGFDPGNRKEFHDTNGNVTGFAYVPPQNYRDRQKIGQFELISLILNNRIADHERQNRYGDAVPIAIDRAAMLAGSALAVNEGTESWGPLFEDPRNSLMDRLFNYGAMLLRAGREEDCLRWAAAASPLYPDTERWQEFTLAAINNNITKLIRANRLPEARNFLEERRALLADSEYAHIDTVLVDTELLGNSNRIRTAAEGDAVISAIVDAHSGGKIPESRAAELITFAVQKTAAVLSAAPARDWRAAINYIENAIERFGTNREFEQALRTFKGNLAADYHNRFAAAWNRRNFDEAERILNEGLSEFPDDRQLLADRETANRYNNGR
jgi:tetratricopeptide (TPR) repeat protein